MFAHSEGSFGGAATVRQKNASSPIGGFRATSENWGTTSLLTTVIESLSSLYTRVFRCFLMGKV